jgi:hypothetical protein
MKKILWYYPIKNKVLNGVAGSTVTGVLMLWRGENPRIFALCLAASGLLSIASQVAVAFLKGLSHEIEMKWDGKAPGQSWKNIWYHFSAFRDVYRDVFLLAVW